MLPSVYVAVTHRLKTVDHRALIIIVVNLLDFVLNETHYIVRQVRYDTVSLLCAIAKTYATLSQRTIFIMY